MKKIRKLINIDPEAKNRLEDIKKEIKDNGGEISITRLIEDSIRIFILYYGKHAIEKYSPSYQLEPECCKHDNCNK